MENSRNTYIVSKALKRFLLASILTSAVGQFAGSLDAVVLAQFEGEEAVSALSLVMPVTTFISCLGLLFAFGANALMARAIGRHDLDGASAIFSTALWSVLLLGIVFSLLMFAALPLMMCLIVPDESLRALPSEYLSIYVLGAWLEMLSYALCLFVATDGRPQRVTLAVFAGVMVNVGVDVLAVGFFEWGIQGVAWGSLSQFAVNCLLLVSWLRHPSCSYRLIWPGDNFCKLFAKNVQEGAPVTVSNILMAVTVLIINTLVYDAQGDNGLFFWSVCLQMLLVSVVFINGVMEALFAIGGVLMGEHDVKGFSMLTKQSLLTVGILSLLLVLLMWIPDMVGVMFGIEDAEEMADMNYVMRSFSLVLPPFSLTLILVAAYQVLARELLCIAVVVGQLTALALSVWLFARDTPDGIWLGFPVGGLLFLTGQLLYSYIYSRRHGCSVSGLTLIPYSQGGRSLDLSIRYQTSEFASAVNKIVGFLKESGVCEDHVFKIRHCSEELITNIANHSRGPVVHHSFDVHVYTKDGHALLVTKDGNRPFNPITADKWASTELSISYKYMFGLNTVMIKV